jgi:hypothetical protein
MQLVATPGVSWGMKVGAGLVLVGIAAGVIWYLRRPASDARPRGTPHDEPAAPLGSSAPKPIAHATKLASPDERKQLAERIANAQASRARGDGRAAVHAPAAPSLPPAATLDPDNPEGTKTTIRTAMREVIPLLSDCYVKAIPSLKTDETKVMAKLTLTGDPDIGTLIDAHEVRDGDGNPLPPAFDDCLRDTMQNIALPPLEGGGTLEVHYPFVFSH